MDGGAQISLSKQLGHKALEQSEEDATSLAMWRVPFRTLLALIVNTPVLWAWANEIGKTLRAHWMHVGEERQYHLCKICAMVI